MSIQTTKLQGIDICLTTYDVGGIAYYAPTDNHTPQNTAEFIAGFNSSNERANFGYGVIAHIYQEKNSQPIWTNDDLPNSKGGLKKGHIGRGNYTIEYILADEETKQEINMLRGRFGEDKKLRVVE